MSEGFLERLKRLRKARKFSQERLAEAIGISYSAYRRYESGERDMPLTVAVRLADLFQVSLDELAGRKG